MWAWWHLVGGHLAGCGYLECCIRALMRAVPSEREKIALSSIDS